MRFNTQYRIGSLYGWLRCFIICCLPGIGLRISHAQIPPHFVWARQAGGTNYDTGHAIAVDALGNSYVTGGFGGRSAFGEVRLTGTGIRGIFIAKYDPGGQLVWAQRGGGAGYDVGTAIAVDRKANVFVTGAFSGTADFGGAKLVSAGGRDIFIAKYDTYGRIQWARRAGGKGEDSGYGIAVAPDGDVCITGYFAGMAEFGNFKLASKGYDDIFIARYSPAGEVRWAKSAGGGQTDVGRAIAIDAGGYICVTGFFHGNAVFEDTTLTNRGSSDVFLARYAPDGGLKWVRQIGGPNEERAYGVATSPAGDVYITGSYFGAAGFGTNGVLRSVGARDVFLAKFDADGRFLWAHTGGGKFEDEGYGIAVDRLGCPYVTGYFKGSAVFAESTVNSGAAPFADKDLFVARYDQNGRLLWVQRAGGRGTDIAYGIAVDAAGQIYLTGSFYGDAYFDQINIAGDGLSTTFVTKMGWQ